MKDYQSFYRYSIENPEAFWREQADLIYWDKKFDQVLDYSNPPFARWYVGGKTNLCFNAVDRHLSNRKSQKGLVFISSETEEVREYSYQDLFDEVNSCARVLQEHGVKAGDRVIIYMPMVPEAVFGVLACVRIGAVHCIVFGGFAPSSLASRIDDSKPKLIMTADAGMRGGRMIPYKPLVDEALGLSKHSACRVLIIDRALYRDFQYVHGRDFDYYKESEKLPQKIVQPEWLESSEPSYISYTSGTTGAPKGVQRDTGGYCVSLAASMNYIYCGFPGETIFTTSDIGWVVGHSYIIYGPLIAGMTTILYEGLPTRPNPSVWWDIVERYKVDLMFSSPTAIRVLKKESLDFIRKHDTTSLKHLFLAGEPLDAPTHQWASEALRVPVIDHFWQTETGWPMITAVPGIEKTPQKLGSPSFPAYGYNVKILSEETEQEVGPGEKGVVTVTPPLPPGCMTTIWGDDKRFVETYFTDFKTKTVYSTFDWGIRDTDGYHFILGRTDDVINVAGHRLGTREIEEAIQVNKNVTEVAVVGVKDQTKGQVPVAFAVLKSQNETIEATNQDELESKIKDDVVKKLGSIARPKYVYLVPMLPKTRSGKLLRRSIQAMAEGREPGDLTTLEDPHALECIRKVLIHVDQD